jgi:hypothetical protein
MKTQEGTKILKTQWKHLVACIYGENILLLSSSVVMVHEAKTCGKNNMNQPPISSFLFSLFGV